MGILPLVAHGVDIYIRYTYPFEDTYTIGWKKRIGDKLYGSYITIKNGEVESVERAMAEYFPLMMEEIARTVTDLQYQKLNEVKNDA